MEPVSDTRIEATRLISAPAADVFAVLCDPQGHVAIDATGMLQDADGEPATAVGDTFVIHMDRESLGDIPDYGRYDVTVTIEDYEQDALVAWSIVGRVKPGIGHVWGYRLQADPDSDGTLVTSYCDWSQARPEWLSIFPVVSETALRGTLGILDRTVRRGYPRSSASAAGQRAE